MIKISQILGLISLVIALMVVMVSCDGEEDASMPLQQQNPYAQALNLIEKAKADNALTLDLGMLDISELPPEIGRLKSLQELILILNNLTSLPREISQLTSLKELNLASNNLVNVPTEITQLTSLEGLDLGDNGLSSLPAEIGQLNNLEELILCDNKLTSLPKEIIQLKSLKKLYLDNNKLKVLPKWIIQLDMEIVWEPDYYYTGEGINLYGNPLEEPPVEIVKRGKRAIEEYFDNSSNNIVGPTTKLTKRQQISYDLALSRIQKAKANNSPSLNLGQLGLSQLPSEIGQLNSLLYLNLEFNNLTFLPTEIGQLTSLRVLNLFGNNLRSLPKEMCQLTSLEKLDIRNNKLKILPQWIILLDMEIVWVDGKYKGRGITLYGNPLEEPPVEVVKRGKDAIEEYFEGK